MLTSLYNKERQTTILIRWMGTILTCGRVTIRIFQVSTLPPSPFRLTHLYGKPVFNKQFSGQELRQFFQAFFVEILSGAEIKILTQTA
jgi:hypothetical protein